MSISSEIFRIKGAIEAAYESVAQKGGIVPPQRVVDSLGAAIASIPSGASTLDTPSITSSRYESGSFDECTLHIGHVDGADRFFVCIAEVAHENVGDYELRVEYIDASAGITDYAIPDFGDSRKQMAFVIAYNSSTGARSEPSNYSLYYIGERCFIKGTMIALANGSEKPVESITWDDELKVWDFDSGCLSAAKPLWIKMPNATGYKFVNRFESGRVIETTGKSNTGWGHRGYNVTRDSFAYFPASVGDYFRLIDGSVDRLMSSSCVPDYAECYNIITERHMNLYANGILTSCSLNNGMYPFDSGTMKFIKQEKPARLNDEFPVPKKFYDGLRLSEQSGDSADITKYVENLIRSSK